MEFVYGVLSANNFPNGAVQSRRVTDAGGATLLGASYTYDVAGRLNTVADVNNTAVKYIADFIYNPRGQATRLTYGNGANVTYTYDPSRAWMTQVRTSGTSVRLDQTYTRDAKGRILRISAVDYANAYDPPRSWVYAYDSLDRLVKARSGVGATFDQAIFAANDTAYPPHFGYDQADNMVKNTALCASNPTMTYMASSTAPMHAPNTICGAAVTYDKNGNTSAYDPDGATGVKPAREIFYDLENRPLLHLSNGSSTIFAYGPDGERTAKKSPSGAVTQYVKSRAILAP